MRNNKLILLILFVVTTLTGLTTLAAERKFVAWVASDNGRVPSNAEAGGYESDGKPLYICRAFYNNGLHIGKVASHLGSCNFGYGGKEYQSKSYEVLVVN
jgi:hypothetical protein